MFPSARPSSTAGGMKQQQQLLGAFVHQSPCASSPHNPILSLASQVIRSNFGPIVQTVADCLQCRGDLPLARLVYYLQQHKKRKCMIGSTTSITDGAANITSPQIRAALLVLLQHRIVTVKQQKQQGRKIDASSKSTSVTIYRYHAEAAVHMIRYAKFVEYIKKAVDFTAACCVEELLLAGRLRTVDLIVQAAEHAPKSDRYTVRQSVMDSFCKLVNAGFIERVSEIEYPTDDDDEDEGEFQFGEEPPPKRAKLNKFDDDDEFLQKGEDPAVIALLKANAHYKSTLPVDAVWRVNMAMFHDSLRAYYLGKLVAERYGHRVQSAGSLVTAALKYRAHLQYGARNNKKQDAALRTGVGDAQTTVFRPADMVKYLPKPVLQLLEKKTGGVSVNLNKSWQELSTLQNPQVVRHVGQDCFEMAVGSLANYLRDRIFYQVVHDRHGEVAARVVSILTVKGWLESDRLAEYAMVPAKDTREVLHHLYRSRYVELFQLSSGRQYNPANTIYLWGVDRARLMLKVKENVATALWNMRLRRDHEVEVGRNWIERAQQAADTDENAHETDKLNYKKFCLGLERLDVAALQLDETLMALCDF